AHHRARPGRHRLERAVRPVRADRCRRHAARASRHPVRRSRAMNRNMTARVRSLVAILALLALPLAGCGDDKPPTYQGWIEANLIFVGPDEAGRVETLSVREGDKVEVGSPLFTLDSDLHKADLNMTMATLANAKQTFERASQLARTGAG